MLARGINPGINLRPSQRTNPWKMNSWAQTGIRNTENELTAGILGTSTRATDPNMLRHELFKYI